MLIKIPPKGEKLINLYKQYSGEPRGVLLVRFLEEGAKRDKGFQQWLKENATLGEGEPVPTKKTAKGKTPAPSVAVESLPPTRPTLVTPPKKSGYDESELR
ncbi:MAG: hypothetical protein JST84_05085 [Acidobacteria bacterium]|nr:hypothetical protein [Acidobacteriota bacterium]